MRGVDTLSDLAGKEVFDARDLGELLDEMESDRQAYEDEVDEKQDELDNLDEDATDEERTEAEDELALARKELQTWDGAYADDLKALQELRDEIGEDALRHGETMVLDTYWPDYVQQLCEDIGDIPRDLPSYIVIDWDATGENIKADYSEIEIDGHTYYYRAH